MEEALRDQLGTRAEIARLEAHLDAHFAPYGPDVRVLLTLGTLHERLDEREAAAACYLRALSAPLPPHRELQLRARIASCTTGRGRPTLRFHTALGTSLVSGPIAVLGRSARTTEVCVPSPTVAREHCVVWFADGTWRVRDLGSTNGTRLEGHPLSGEGALGRCAVLRLADERVEVVVLGDP